MKCFVADEKDLSSEDFVSGQAPPKSSENKKSELILPTVKVDSAQLPNFWHKVWIEKSLIFTWSKKSLFTIVYKWNDVL